MSSTTSAACPCTVCVSVQGSPPSELEALEFRKHVPPSAEWKNASRPKCRDIQEELSKDLYTQGEVIDDHIHIPNLHYISSPLNPHDVDHQEHYLDDTLDFIISKP